MLCGRRAGIVPRRQPAFISEFAANCGVAYKMNCVRQLDNAARAIRAGRNGFIVGNTRAKHSIGNSAGNHEEFHLPSFDSAIIACAD